MNYMIIYNLKNNLHQMPDYSCLHLSSRQASNRLYISQVSPQRCILRSRLVEIKNTNVKIQQ